MYGYMVDKKKTTSSNQITLRDVSGSEETFLVNDESGFDSAVTGSIVCYQVNPDKTWRNKRIIDKLSLAEKSDDSPEYLELMKCYGPKSVPKFGDVINLAVNWVNTTKDCKYGNKPRIVNVDSFKSATNNYFVNYDGKKRGKDFMNCPASTKYHDSQVGGLFRHVSKMIEIAVKIFSDDSMFNEYNKEPLLLLIGILLHDAGKIDQYETNEVGNITTKVEAYHMGSHLGISLDMWARNGVNFLREIGIDESEIPYFRTEVWHLIASHHGPTKYGFGSLTDPDTPMAWALHNIDCLESRQAEEYIPTTD